MTQYDEPFIFQLPHTASLVYPKTKSLKNLWLKSRFIFWGITKYRTLRKTCSLLNNDLFKLAVAHESRTIEKPLKPYLFIDNSPAQRATYIEEHFNYLQRNLGPRIEDVYHKKDLSIFEFSDTKDRSYRVVLFMGEIREGSLGLRVVNEHDQTVYSISFNLATSPVKTINIGALKGTSQGVENSNEVIKSITRSLHGLRPKALMLELLIMFGKALGFERIVAISNQGHIYQALRYMGSKRKSVTFDYDELWYELGATRIDKYRFDIPMNLPRKDCSTLKKNKRRLYSKRYDWLTETELTISERVGELLVK